VQETFISVWRSIERYDPKRASVRTWLMRIVHRRAIDGLRSQMVHLKRRAEGEGVAETIERRTRRRTRSRFSATNR